MYAAGGHKQNWKTSKKFAMEATQRIGARSCKRVGLEIRINPPPSSLAPRLRPCWDFLSSTVSESPHKPATGPSRPRRCAGVPQWQTTYFRSSQAVPGGKERLWRRAPGCREVETPGTPPPRQLKAWLATFEGLGVLAGLESWAVGASPAGCRGDDHANLSATTPLLVATRRHVTRRILSGPIPSKSGSSERG
jgi:hypothetical protein